MPRRLFTDLWRDIDLAGSYTSPALVESAGGLLGASALLSYVVLAPKVGLSVLLRLAVAGQITSSLVIDHFGLIGVVERPVSPVKFGGSMAMLASLAIALFRDK